MKSVMTGRIIVQGLSRSGYSEQINNMKHLENGLSSLQCQDDPYPGIDLGAAGSFTGDLGAAGSFTGDFGEAGSPFQDEVYESEGEFEQEEYMVNYIDSDSALKHDLCQVYQIQNILEGGDLTANQAKYYEDLRGKLLNQIDSEVSTPIKIDPDIIHTYKRLKNSPPVLTADLEEIDKIINIKNVKNLDYASMIYLNALQSVEGLSAFEKGLGQKIQEIIMS